MQSEPTQLEGSDRRVALRSEVMGEPQAEDIRAAEQHAGLILP